MTLEIIGIPQSSYVRTVRMVAEEKGVAYTLVPEMPHSEAVRSIHPFGKVPVIRHDGFELAESTAIAHYIDRAFEGPPLMPADLKRSAKIEQWISIVNTTIDITMIRRYVLEYLFHKDDNGEVVRDQIDHSVASFPKQFEALGKAVANGWLASESFSMADCFLAPILFYVQKFPEGAEHVGKAPAVRDYYARLAERPSFVSTTPPPAGG